MARGKAEDAGGLTPAKDDNTALYHFAPRTLPIFKCVDYKARDTGEIPCLCFYALVSWLRLATSSRRIW